MTVEQAVSEMVRRLAEAFQPEKVILFGSFGRGDAAEDSDVDLLVVVRDISDRRALRIAMRSALNDVKVSKDIIVLSVDEFERKRKIPGTIAYPADKEGKVLYAA